MDARLIDSSQSMAVQRIMESDAEYSRRVEGAVPTPTAAGEVLSALPPGVPSSQKVDLGLWDGQEFVAFADVIVAWPSEPVAHIGLLMTDGARQGEGLGRMTQGLPHDQVTSVLACLRVARSREDGITIAQIAKDFGVHEMTLH